MNKYQERQAKQERQLIAAIQAKPGYQVFPGQFGGCVMIVQNLPNGVSQRSVWLGRAGTIDRFKQILAS